jgi:hypothetical protein
MVVAMKTPIVFLLITISLYISSLPLYGQPTNDDSIRATIVFVQEEIVDLTNPLEPLNCKKFVAARRSLTQETADQIVKLIQHGNLSNTQSEIGALLLSGLPEDNYLKTTKQLIAATTQEEVLNTLLMPPLPYGPGYANACKENELKTMLVALRSNPACSQEVKAVLDFIMSGKASSNYSDYKKHPDQYGY